MSVKDDKSILSLSWQQITFAFVVGLLAALLVDAVRNRFFRPVPDIYYVQLGDFIGEKIKTYGSYEYSGENDQDKLALVFANALENSLQEMQSEYKAPILSGPAVISGGLDLTAELDRRVTERMDRYTLEKK